MRRIALLFVVLVIGLSVALYVRLSRQDAAREAPSGGTGTVEGIEVDVVPRISARIVALRVEEGDPVRAGQVLVELDCAEPLALRDEAAARLALARSGVRGARAAARAAGHTVQGGRAAEHMARHQAASAKELALAATEAERAAAAQEVALGAERAVAGRNARRIASLRRTEVGTESDLDVAAGRSDSLEHQVAAAGASTRAAAARARAEADRVNAARAQTEGARAQRQALEAQQAGAAAQTAGARHSVEAARAALRRAQSLVEECALRAPRDGIVLTRNYEPGEVVLPGARIYTLADLREVKTTFYLPNADLAHAAPGRAVQLVADAYPGEVFAGRILSVSAKAEFTPRNIQTREDRDRLVYAVKVRVPNPEGKLRPGMPVEVRIPGTSRSRR